MNLLELANDPATVTVGFPAAVHVLGQTNLDAAAQALGGRLSYCEPHAPLGPSHDQCRDALAASVARPPPSGLT